jgi:hypothetical protein
MGEKSQIVLFIFYLQPFIYIFPCPTSQPRAPCSHQGIWTRVFRVPTHHTTTTLWHFRLCYCTIFILLYHITGWGAGANETGTKQRRCTHGDSNEHPRTQRTNLLPLDHFGNCNALMIVRYIRRSMELRDHVAAPGWLSCFAGPHGSFSPSFFLFNLKLKFEIGVSQPQ